MHKENMQNLHRKAHPVRTGIQTGDLLTNWPSAPPYEFLWFIFFVQKVGFPGFANNILLRL